jgi:transcriptional regulator with XRE-family HTH domain
MNGGDYVYLARQQAGLTQTEVALRAGCAQNEVARIEKGHVKASFERVCNLIRACGYDLDFTFAPVDISYLGEITSRLEMEPAERISNGMNFARQIQRLQPASVE